LLFFHPLAWLCARRQIERAEEICDDWVVGQTGRYQEYATQLVDLAEAQQSDSNLILAGLPMASFRSVLRQRVERILDGSRVVHWRLGWSKVIGIGLVMLSSLILLSLWRPIQEDAAVEVKLAQTSETAPVAKVEVKSTQTPAPPAPARRYTPSPLLKSIQASDIQDPEVLTLAYQSTPSPLLKWIQTSGPRDPAYQYAPYTPQLPYPNPLSARSSDRFAYYSKASVSSDPIRVEAIEVIYVGGPARWPASEILATMDLKKGQSYRKDALPSALRRNVRALYETGRLTNLRIHDDTFQQGIKLVVIVQCNPVLKNIQIRGAESLDQAQLRQILQLKEGMEYSGYRAFQEAKRLETYLKQQGWNEAKVTPTVAQHEAEGTSDLTLTVIGSGGDDEKNKME
jgi:hypothetical protein